MTSTNFTVGLDGTRVSSKVIKPPGGGSSDIFGLGGSQHSYTNTQPKKDDSSTQNRLFGSSSDTKSSVPVNKNQSHVFANQNQAPSSVKKPYVRRNPITGEGIQYPGNEKSENGVKEEEDIQNGENGIQNDENDNDEKKTEVEDKPQQAPTRVIQTSIRVRNPPGGKSSGIF